MAGPRTVTTFGGQVFVILNPVAIAELMRSPVGPVMRHMFVVGEKVKIEAIRLAPKRSGNMSQHIVKRTASIDGKPSVLVGVENVKYAYWVHEGTVPHDIFPVNARVLAFPGRDGKMVFTQHVSHPGTKPNRFLVRALQHVVPGLVKGI